MSVFDFPRLHFAGTAISRLPTGPKASVVDLGTGRVEEVREGTNFGGNGHFLIDAAVVGVDMTEADLDRADPVIGRAVDMWGHHNEYLGTTVNRARIFDVDPASRFSTTVMVGQFGFGRAGRSHDTGYMVTGQVRGFQPPRWQRPGQVVHQFVVDKADGLNWLPETDRSAAVTALRSVVADGCADGLVVQFVLTSTGVSGTIGPWKPHEPRTYPAGRLLTWCDGEGSNLTVDVGGSAVQLNLVEPLPAGCRLRVAQSREVVARLPADRVGIVRADLCGPYGQAGVEQLEVVDGTGAVLLAEQEVNVQVDDACVILEHPSGGDDHNHDVRVQVRSFVRGVPASVPAIHVRQCPNPEALPREEQRDLVIVAIDGGVTGVVGTDEAGLGTFSLRGLRAGTARLSLTVDQVDTPNGHDDERHFARAGAMTVRVLPDDWWLDTVPADQVTFDLVYREVLQPYEQLYSFMRDEVFSLADEFKVQTYAKLVWQMCDPRNKGRTYYMPPSRDLTAPKARLLLRFLRQQQKPAQVTRILPSSGRDRPGISTRGELVAALGQAAVVELAVMLQYLYAAYSVPTHGAGLEYTRLGVWTPEQLAVACGDGGESLDTGIRSSLLSIAREEMMHFLMVNNILMAIGEPFTVPRIDFGTINDELPIALDFSLEALGLGSVQRFIEIEQPESAVGEVQLGDVIESGAEPPASYASLSELYGDIRDGLRRVPDLFVVEKGRGGGEHHLFLRRSIDLDHPDYQMEVDDLPSALFAVDVITEQGEGNVLTSERPDEESHHAAFTRLAGLLADDPTWRPAYPVLRNPTLCDGNRIKDLVTVADTRAAMQLFNDSYFMMLQLMVQHFGGQPDSSLRRSALMNHAIDVMTGMMRPLAELIVTMPSGRRGRTAGPSFELPGQPAYISRPDVASRAIAQRFQRIAEEAAKQPLVPARVSEQSGFLCDYFRAVAEERSVK